MLELLRFNYTFYLVVSTRAAVPRKKGVANFVCWGVPLHEHLFSGQPVSNYILFIGSNDMEG